MVLTMAVSEALRSSVFTGQQVVSHGSKSRPSDSLPLQVFHISASDKKVSSQSGPNHDARMFAKSVSFKTARRGVPCGASDGSVAVATEQQIKEAISEDGAVETSEPEVPIEFRIDPYPTVLDINQIRDILPHRYPFLLVDRVIELNPGVSAVAIKNVTINDNFFPGHFPERPIMPGVLMVEAMAQVGGIVMLNPEVGGSKDKFFFAGIDKVRFRKPVVAGDTLVMRMTLTKLNKRFGIAKMDGKAYVGKDLVCEGEFLMALGS